jgi:hypothetical protein
VKGESQRDNSLRLTKTSRRRHWLPHILNSPHANAHIMDLNVKMDDDDDHHHSLHDDLGPVVPPEEIHPPPDTDSQFGLEHDESSRKRLAYDEFPDDDDDEDESNKRRRKSAPPQKKLNDDQWAEMFTRLLQYKEQHGVSSQ